LVALSPALRPHVSAESTADAWREATY
jgi:hypothetical protein